MEVFYTRFFITLLILTISFRKDTNPGVIIAYFVEPVIYWRPLLAVAHNQSSFACSSLSWMNLAWSALIHTKISSNIGLTQVASCHLDFAFQLIFMVKLLHRVVLTAYTFLRVSRATTSTWLVWGNISTGCATSSWYPPSTRILTSRASVDESHDT